ncbi:MAG: hypothetical protein LBG06_07585, partial [Deltaproteobacteria bacterium]|nr:hypothetical protein [Deltaproteobacteria bacterium]
RLGALGVSEELLRDNGCVNVAAAAWILRSALAEGGGPLEAVASYHSRKPGRRRAYLRAALARAPRLDVARTLARANGAPAPGPGAPGRGAASGGRRPGALSGPAAAPPGAAAAPAAGRRAR